MTAPAPVQYADMARREYANCPPPAAELTDQVGLMIQPALRALAGEHGAAADDAA